MLRNAKQCWPSSSNVKLATPAMFIPQLLCNQTASLNLDASSAVQLALEPLWKLYEVCNPGADADVKATLSKAVKSLNLTQVRPFLPPLLLPICSFDLNQDLPIRVGAELGTAGPKTLIAIAYQTV